VNKHILAILTADEAKPLGIVKPLYCSLFHFRYFLKAFLNLPLEQIWVHQLDTLQPLQKTRLLQTMNQE
jgi:hypothetical protein